MNDEKKPRTGMDYIAYHLIEQSKKHHKDEAPITEEDIEKYKNAIGDLMSAVKNNSDINSRD